MKIALPEPQIRRSRWSGGFTMVEIAIAVAVIAFALVAIIGVLPAGLQVQKENREETIISQDGVFFMDAIRSGAEGVDDLTNYVVRIDTNGVPATVYQSGADIIGLLSTPGTNRAIVRAISGAVSELGPATTQVAFKYDLEVQMLAFDSPTNALNNRLHEVRLLFRWPILPNGTLGNSRQIFRTMMSGEFQVYTNKSASYYYLRP